MIDVTHYSQTFGKRTVLSDVQFSIGQGEIVGLIGPSGSGKTTLIKSLIGLQQPTTGTIMVLGTKQPSLAQAENIGYMAQSDALYEDLTARGNLRYFGKLYGLKKARLRARIETVLEFVDLKKDADRPIHQFSGGMKRRLSLAIALIHEPSLLLLDEPTVGIDPALKKTFWHEFEQLRQSGVTVLVTTHVMDEAERCDRLLLIQHGRLIEAGTPDDLIKRFGSIDEAFIQKERV
ncbi:MULTISPECIES: ABC transporter ATP-binding protein [Exiguobacterium]|uniref:ABC transporter ATP-binding protein n=1 Tax=Exiguobacterium antarcticum TaxID=132920 RepID=A0ABT6R344_9BACL|nr:MULTISPECIES: ABC transporter ATP-binding protein [Exiguobacterium]AFS70080.1 ABC transporter [Exiguobacterium antarcticum B7]MCT4781184.1 ABC transporter ATP-binding protein [Exiguobacterium soli]MDI3235373.1 ABC transporter ATP-binding protein [Exiguobacterium antarcticum]